MNPIVVKFGGSSLATAGQFEKVTAIIRENPGRRYVVASAPGKRFSGDTKVTDLLYRCYDAACAGQDFAPVLDEIRQRFADIISELQLQVDLAPDFAAIEAHLRTSPQRDYMASRGEYLNSKLLAAYLGFAFVDAAQMSCSAQTAPLTPRPRTQPSVTRSSASTAPSSPASTARCPTAPSIPSPAAAPT